MAELTGLLRRSAGGDRLATWPPDMRIICRRERPSSGAQLSLTEPGGIILLAGVHASVAEQLVQLAGVTCLLVDAPLSSSAGVVNLEVADRMPLAEGALKGAAVDAPRATEAFLAGIARCVRPLGRIVAPSGSTPPGGCRLIARDEQEWVAEVEEFIAPLTLRRANQA